MISGNASSVIRSYRLKQIHIKLRTVLISSVLVQIYRPLFELGLLGYSKIEIAYDVSY